MGRVIFNCCIISFLLLCDCFAQKKKRTLDEDISKYAAIIANNRLSKSLHDDIALKLIDVALKINPNNDLAILLQAKIEKDIKPELIKTSVTEKKFCSVVLSRAESIRKNLYPKDQKLGILSALYYATVQMWTPNEDKILLGLKKLENDKVKTDINEILEDGWTYASLRKSDKPVLADNKVKPVKEQKLPAEYRDALLFYNFSEKDSIRKDNRTVIKDMTNNGNDAILKNAQFEIEGNLSVLTFNGLDHRLDIQYKDKRPQQSFTVSTWIKADRQIPIHVEKKAGADGLNKLFQNNWFLSSKGNKSPEDANIGATYGNNGLIVYEAGALHFPATTVLEHKFGDKWTHIAIVYNSNKASIFVNGVRKHTGVRSIKKNIFSPETIGGIFIGKVDSFAIWKASLNEAKIKKLASQR